MENDRGCLCHKEAFGGWRNLLLAPVVVTNRVVLWSLGFWDIQIDDRRKDKHKLANVVVVAPHMNMVDPFIIAAAFPPLLSAVGKAEVLDMPFMCHFGVAAQGIFVDRRNPESRRACKEAIARRADPSWRGMPLLIFPEGTTTNGKVLIQFKLGPFSPGQPVQPVLLKYRCKNFDFAWAGKNSNLGLCILRMMWQFANYCTVIILDTHQPSEEEVKDPVLFASNVRAKMAKELGVPATEHSYDDVWFGADAVKANIRQDFEVGEISKLYNLDLESLKVLLKKFQDADTDNSGHISVDEFEKALGLSNRSRASLENFFSFFDTDGSGQIEYPQFLQGLALLSDNCSSVMSKAKLAFLIFDFEGSGRVKVEDLRQALHNSVAHVGGASVVSFPNVDSLTFDEFVALVEREPAVLQEALEVSRARIGLTFETAKEVAVKAREEKGTKKHR